SPFHIMRNTGSREPRDKREASVTSPVSIAVKTFSIRFGSRRIHRPVHQNARSMTTATPMTDTIRIGHMIGPPFWKLSIRKFVQPVLGGGAGGAAGLAAGEAAALKVAETAGLGIAPGAAGEGAGAPGTPGDGITPGAAGDATAPGAPGDVATPGGRGRAGVVAAGGGGGGGGGWATAVNVTAATAANTGNVRHCYS